MHDKVRDILADLRGKSIWDVMGGPIHGSTLGMEIGARRLRDVPLTNPRVSEELRRFEGEYGLLITCSSRFSINDTIVFGSLSRNETDGDIVGGVTQLVGRTIVGAEIDSLFLDFTLDVNDGRFSVFCDEVDPQSDRDNYYITLEDSILVVGPASVVRQEPREFAFRPPLRVV